MLVSFLGVLDLLAGRHEEGGKGDIKGMMDGMAWHGVATGWRYERILR